MGSVMRRLRKSTRGYSARMATFDFETTSLGLKYDPGQWVTFLGGDFYHADSPTGRTPKPPRMQSMASTVGYEYREELRSGPSRAPTRISSSWMSLDHLPFAGTGNAGTSWEVFSELVRDRETALDQLFPHQRDSYFEALAEHARKVEHAAEQIEAFHETLRRDWPKTGGAT